MALRNSIPFVFRPTGLSDTLDGSNVFPGAMAALSNLIPAPGSGNMWVPRPASQLLSNVGVPGAIGSLTALLPVGTLLFGMANQLTGPFAGLDVPFVFNLATNAFVSLAGRTVANLPTTQPTSGDWTPPRMAFVAGRVMVTHPGFSGATPGSAKVGFIDVSGFSSATITGNTNTSNRVTGLSTNVLLAGWQPGMSITDLAADIPAGTTILSIDVGGLALTMSAAATGSNATTFTVAGGTLAAPVWGAGDMNNNPFVSIPVAVAIFNNRAYYAMAPNASNVAIQASDPSVPLQQTNASQAINFKNGLFVTALAGLPLTSQTAGGIIGSLIAFQGSADAWQITGDFVTSNLATNELNVATGTLAPNTIASTPAGLAFIAPDGLRVINQQAQVGPVIGAYGSGVCVPFQRAVNPSRMCAAYNQSVYRVSVTNGAAAGAPIQEYWFDFNLKVWSGPHSFPSALIVPSQAAGQNFIAAAAGINAKLWASTVIPGLNANYTENGVALSWTFATSLWPDNEGMAMNSMVETMWMLGLGQGVNPFVQVIDEGGNVLDTVSLTGRGSPASAWGSMTWGVSPWGGGSSPVAQSQLGWHQPLVFKQAQLRATGLSAAGVVLGNLYPRTELLGYVTQNDYSALSM